MFMESRYMFMAHHDGISPMWIVKAADRVQGRPPAGF